jgi:hypothetical protein
MNGMAFQNMRNATGSIPRRVLLMSRVEHQVPSRPTGCVQHFRPCAKLRTKSNGANDDGDTGP